MKVSDSTSSTELLKAEDCTEMHGPGAGIVRIGRSASGSSEHSQDMITGSTKPSVIRCLGRQETRRPIPFGNLY